MALSGDEHPSGVHRPGPVILRSQEQPGRLRRVRRGRVPGRHGREQGRELAVERLVTGIVAPRPSRPLAAVLRAFAARTAASYSSNRSRSFWVYGVARSSSIIISCLSLCSEKNKAQPSEGPRLWLQSRCYLPDLRLDTTSKMTATSSTPPLTTYCQESVMPMMDMLMFSTPSSMAPMTTPPRPRRPKGDRHSFACGHSVSYSISRKPPLGNRTAALFPGPAHKSIRARVRELVDHELIYQ